MNYKSIIESRIKSLEMDLETGIWKGLEQKISGKIAAYEEVLNDIEMGVLV